ncbi:MAG: phage tail protein [Phenylobacterium sp.]|jgi:phage tail-like protein|nr:phage tail protein [Phenylobacterium sp.]
MARNDPFRNFRFRLEIDGIQQAGFSEVAIAETTTDAIDYREGNEPTHVRKLSGLNKYGNITLKYGVTTDSIQLFNWHKKIVEGQIAANRKKVTIVVMDETGADKARFVVSEAWPVKYDPSDLNAKGNEVFIEALELVNEGMERVA